MQKFRPTTDAFPLALPPPFHQRLTPYPLAFQVEAYRNGAAFATVFPCASERHSPPALLPSRLQTPQPSALLPSRLQIPQPLRPLPSAAAAPAMTSPLRSRSLLRTADLWVAAAGAAVWIAVCCTPFPAFDRGAAGGGRATSPCCRSCCSMLVDGGGEAGAAGFGT